MLSEDIKKVSEVLLEKIKAMPLKAGVTSNFIWVKTQYRTEVTLCTEKAGHIPLVTVVQGRIYLSVNPFRDEEKLLRILEDLVEVL